MKARFIAAVLILHILIIFSGCLKKQSSTESETSKDTGYPVNVNGVEIAAPPSRVAVLSPSLAEIISDMGFGSTIIVRSEECRYPESVASLPTAGSVLLPDMDVIISSKPDLFLTQKEQSDTVKTLLKQNNIPVIVIPAAQDFNGLSELYKTIGKIFLGAGEGVEKGSSYMSHIEKILEDIENTVSSYSADSPRKRAVYVADSFGHVATGDTVINHLITSAGAVNPAENQTDWKADESTLSSAEIIFCPKALAEKVKNISGLKNSPAIKNKKIFEIDAEQIESQGLRMIDATEQMAKILYPDAFPQPTAATTNETSATT